MIQLPIFYEGSPGTTDQELIDYVTSNSDIQFLVCNSGGKDSIAMTLHLLELGIPKNRITLHHHDIDGHQHNLFDWPCTPSYMHAFAAAMDLELLFSYRHGGIVREMYRQNEGLQSVFYQQAPYGKYVELKSRPGNSTRMKFPAVAADLRTRWCSAVVKIDVMSRVVANHPDYQHGKFVICTGERRQESANRAKYNEIELYRSNSKSRKCWQWRPIINWSEEQVWLALEAWKIQPHPCYELGWSRCSCQTCIFSSANTWAAINDIAPWKVNEIAAMERQFGFTLYNGMTIKEKVAKGTSFVKPEMKARWADEAMSEFCSPIFVNNWTQPQGAFSSESGGSV